MQYGSQGVRGSSDEETLASYAPTPVSEFALLRLSDDRGAQDETYRVGRPAHSPGTFGRCYHTYQYQNLVDLVTSSSVVGYEILFL